MAVDTNIYDARFFENIIKLESQRAREVVGILIKYFHPESVIDIGCGPGIYLKEFILKGVEILGYDGSPAAAEKSLVGDKIKLHDLCQPLKLDRRFDLCLCIEVAEHLPFNCAKNLINILINLSSIIVFTAATPGQGPKSMGHINEQPHEFWIDLFQKKQFIYQKKLSEKIRKEMGLKNVVWWIVKNLMIFKND